VTSLLASAAAGMLLLALPGQTAVNSWEALAAQGRVINTVDIVVNDVFDLSRPSENNWISRLANRAHVESRRGVVERELLFAAGEVVDAERIRETERNLRRHPFVREARIVPLVGDDARVVARVEVDDAWSLVGNVDLSRSGGNLEWSARLDELNLLGTGKRVFFEREHTIERDANAFGYIDPQVLGSRWTMSAAYSDLSDGSSRFVVVERPYFSIEARYAVGGFVSTSDRLLTQYNNGAAVHVFPQFRETASVSASGAVWRGDRAAHRVGLAFRADDAEYGTPVTLRAGQLPTPDTSLRRVRGLAANWVYVEDRSVPFQNFARIGRTEDYNVGWVISGSAGFAPKIFGSTTDAPFGDFGVRKGWSSGSHALILADAAYRGRREADGWRDAFGRASVTAYRRIAGGQTVAGQVTLTSWTRPDAADWLYLGGRDGLRGYVDHFLAGDRRFTMSLEDRIVTGWRPMGLFQAGFVGYFDAGTIRRADTGAWSRTYANVGAGIRFGLLKSGRGNLILISAAMPIVRDPGMDRVLLVLGNSLGF
jgi:hypothetical protein